MAGGYTQQHNFYSSLVGAIRHHPKVDAVVLTVIAVVAYGIMALTSGDSPSIPQQNLNFNNGSNAGQQTNNQSPSSLDGIVSATPTPTITGATAYPTPTATPNPDPYNTKSIIAEINATGANSTSGDIKRWTLYAFEIHKDYSNNASVAAQRILKATLSNAYGPHNGDPKVAVGITEACYLNHKGRPMTEEEIKESIERLRIAHPQVQNRDPEEIVGILMNNLTDGDVGNWCSER